MADITNQIGSVTAMGTIDSTHPKYNAALPKVRKMRDFIASNVHKSPYIRQLPGQSQADFELYAQTAYYLPAVPRTVDAFAGLIMLDIFEHGLTEAMKPFIDDVTNDGEPLSRVAGRAVREVVTTGRAFILNDFPTVDPNLSRAEVEALGVRPYWTLYRFEDVFNWRTEVKNGRKRLTQVRLWETYTWQDPDVEWNTEERRQIRVVDLWSPEQGVPRRVRARVYQETTVKKPNEPEKQLPPNVRVVDKSSRTEKAWELTEISFPMQNGQFLTDIPGVMLGTDSLDPAEVDIPPLNELADVSCSHLVDSANRQWALAWCGNPIPWIADDAMQGDESASVKMGASTVLILGSEASAGVLALGADGVGALKESMDDKRRDMAAIGARILTDGGSQQISTETALLERAGEHSVLQSISSTISDGLTKAFRMLVEWAGINAPADMKIELNKDFVPSGLATGQLTEWVDAMIKGTVPLSVLFRKLKEAKELPPDMTEEKFTEGLMALEELGFGLPTADRDDDLDEEDEQDDEDADDDEGDDDDEDDEN